MKVPNDVGEFIPPRLSLSRLQNEGSQLVEVDREPSHKSIKATE